MAATATAVTADDDENPQTTFIETRSKLVLQSRVDLGILGQPLGRTQRKPMCVVEESTAWPWRAAGR